MHFPCFVCKQHFEVNSTHIFINEALDFLKEPGCKTPAGYQGSLMGPDSGAGSPSSLSLSLQG